MDYTYYYDMTGDYYNYLAYPEIYQYGDMYGR